MSQRSKTKTKILTILFILFLTVKLQNYEPKQLIIATTPLVTQQGNREIKSVCFADCKSCQVKTGDCETCYSPFFQLRQGKCVLAYPQYKLESTEEEQRFVNFISSSEWSYNDLPVSSRVCTPNATILSKNFTIIGPFNTGKVTYQRTLSRHNYFGIKFLLILSNWTSTDTTISMKVTNQADIVLFSQNFSIDNSQINVADRDPLCSTSSLDRRVSVDMKLIEEQSSQIKIVFQGIMGVGATWGLSSFVLVTGSCHQKCSMCSGYTPVVASCSKCNNFLSNNITSGQKCSTCLNGFALIQNSTRCEKCPIQYKECRFNETANTVCLYSNLTNSTNNCSFINEVYYDSKQITEATFFSSLFSIQGKGAFVTKCGSYSVVGPANFGDIITRTFVQLPPHISLSLTFNIFIFQQQDQNQNYTVAILLNGQPFPIPPTQQSIIITGTSNQCDTVPLVSTMNRKFEAMRTFQTQTFVNHNKLENVVVGVTLGTSNANSQTKWGLRDMRIVFRRCDQNCQLCTQTGCQRCRGFYSLVNLTCTTCMAGTGINPKSSNCQPCPQSCTQCLFDRVPGALVCKKCQLGFYLYTDPTNTSTTCQPTPNLGPFVSGKIAENGNCNVTIQSTNKIPSKTTQFDIGQNRASRGFTLEPSIRKIIQFDLMKIDNWDGDYLDFYANDLLVKRYQFGNSGGFFCQVGQEGDQVSFQQFQIQDDSKNLKLEFQAVTKDPAKVRRFGIGNLKIYPIGCQICKNYDFGYKVKYNYDQRLFAELAFNLVYQNKDPQQFKNIFKMKAGDKYLDYQISSNDSIRYWLKSASIPQGQIIDKNLSIECTYPYRVTTMLPTSTNNSDGEYFYNKDTFFQGPQVRNLQQINPNVYQNRKSLDNNFAYINVERYSPLRGRESSILGLQTFFSVLTRIVVYLGFASFFIGCQTPCTHVMHNFQKIWVHIYVGALALSPIFKTALWGFRECQDQNIAINPEQWESGLPKYLYYDAPAQYQHYYKDITFFRNIYNIAVAFAILLASYFILRLLIKTCSKSQHLIFRHLRSVFTHRPLFFFNSVIFYQYFTLCLACTLQFLDLKTHTNYSAFSGVNAAATIIAFIFATLYPIIFHFILHKKRFNVLSLLETIMGNNRNKDFTTHQRDLELLEEEHVVYNNRYSEIFYRFLPKELWHQNLAESKLISQKHVFYNIFRFGELWWHAIVVILLHDSPFAQAFLLILTNGFHLAVNTFASLNTTKFFRIMKSLELVFFIVIEIMIIVMLSLLKTLRFESYETLGIVAIIFVFFILMVTFLRFIYTMYRLYRQYNPLDDADPRMVIRRDRGYDQGWMMQK